MESLSSQIRSIAMGAGADLVGFAPVARFATGPEKTQPNYYLPDARSVVSIAIAYPHGFGARIPKRAPCRFNMQIRL